MDSKNDLLLKSAARLYSLGIELDAARDRLRQLVERGVPYESEEMASAYRDFTELEALWTGMEQQHQELRDEIVGIS